MAKKKSKAWLERLTQEHPAVVLTALLAGLLSIPGSCVGMFTGLRELRKPDEAVLAGVDRDPRVTMTFDGSSCVLTSDDARDIVAVQLVGDTITVNPTTSSGIGGSGRATMQGERAVLGTLAFGESARGSLPPIVREQLCSDLAKRAFPEKFAGGAESFIACTATYHRAGDQQGYRLRRWVYVDRRGPTCELKELGLFRSTTHDVENGRLIGERWNDPSIERAFRAVQTYEANVSEPLRAAGGPIQTAEAIREP